MYCMYLLCYIYNRYVQYIQTILEPIILIHDMVYVSSLRPVVRSTVTVPRRAPAKPCLRGGRGAAGAAAPGAAGALRGQGREDAAAAPERPGRPAG